MRFDLIHLLGGKCVKCNNENMYELEVDHINNDGDGDRRFYTEPYKKWLGRPELAKKRLQVLCKSCHEDKHRLANEQPLFEVPVFFKELGFVVQTMKELEGEEKKEVSVHKLIAMLSGKEYSDLQYSVYNLVKRAQMEGMIYESSPRHYRVV